MFSFHKSDALPRSRQSSIDSPVTIPSTFSTSDLWVSHENSPASHGAMHSPERHNKAQINKRSSVFNIRSRSNTAISTTPSLMSLSHPDMAEHDTSLHDPPPDHRILTDSSQMEIPGIMTRRSLFRGKKGKRLSESVVSSIDSIEYKEPDVGGKRTSVLRKGRRANNQSEGSSKYCLSAEMSHRSLNPQSEVFDIAFLAHLTFNTLPIPIDIILPPSKKRLAIVWPQGFGQCAHPNRPIEASPAFGLTICNSRTSRLRI